MFFEKRKLWMGYWLEIETCPLCSTYPIHIALGTRARVLSHFFSWKELPFLWINYLYPVNLIFSLQDNSGQWRIGEVVVAQTLLWERNLLTVWNSNSHTMCVRYSGKEELEWSFSMSFIKCYLTGKIDWSGENK